MTNRTIPLSEYHILRTGIEYHLYFKRYTVYVIYRINNGEESLELTHEMANFKTLREATKLLTSMKSKDEIGPLISLKWQLPNAS
jgi:hypothetical protein